MLSEPQSVDRLAWLGLGRRETNIWAHDDSRMVKSTTDAVSTIVLQLKEWVGT